MTSDPIVDQGDIVQRDKDMGVQLTHSQNPQDHSSDPHSRTQDHSSNFHSSDPHSHPQDPHSSNFHSNDPHSSNFHSNDPHSSNIHSNDPHSSSFHSSDPHSHPQDPHSSNFHSNDPHSSSFHSNDPHSQDPHSDPHSSNFHSQDPHSSSFHSNDPHSQDPHSDPHSSNFHSQDPHSHSIDPNSSNFHSSDSHSHSHSQGSAALDVTINLAPAQPQPNEFETHNDNLDICKLTPLTRLELSRYNGIIRPQIYVAIRGMVYDVSGNVKNYGPQGSYHKLVGKDVSRLLGINRLHINDQTRVSTGGDGDDVGDSDAARPMPDPFFKENTWYTEDFNDKQNGLVDQWIRFFKKRYRIVGLVVDHELCSSMH